MNTSSLPRPNPSQEREFLCRVRGQLKTGEPAKIEKALKDIEARIQTLKN